MKPAGESAELQKRFLAFLASKGSATLAETQKALGLKDGKAVGSLVGLMNRWAGKKPGFAKIEVKDGKGGERTYAIPKWIA